MLQSVSKQNFKTGAAISAVIDPASVLEGQTLSPRTGVTFRDRRGNVLLTDAQFLAEYGMPYLKLGSIRLVQRYPIS